MPWNQEHYMLQFLRRMKRLAAKRRHMRRDDREKKLAAIRRKAPSRDIDTE